MPFEIVACNVIIHYWSDVIPAGGVIAIIICLYGYVNASPQCFGEGRKLVKGQTSIQVLGNGAGTCGKENGTGQSADTGQCVAASSTSSQ